MSFTDDERAILLRALFELTVTRSAFDADPDRDSIPIATIRTEEINALVKKLGGDPDAPLFGSSL